MAAMLAARALQTIWEPKGSSAGSPDLGYVQQHTAIRVIDHQGDVRGWQASELFKSCHATGFSNTSMSCHPCNLQFVVHDRTLRKFNPCVEVAAAIDSKFYPQCLRDASGLAIIVSHLRCLAEAGHSINDTGVIVVFERDVVQGPNCFMQLLFLLKTWFGMTPSKRPHYMGLITSTDRIDHSKPIVDLASVTRPKAATQHWYWLPFPWVPKGQGHQALQHLGQGARGYAVDCAFARWLIGQRVWCWWDVYLCGEACSYALQRRHGDKETTVLLYPPVGVHPVNLSETTRGSDRLKSQLPNAAAAHSPFVTLELKPGWGISNRLNTMSCVMTACNHAGLGLYILWTRGEACQNQFEDIIGLADSYPEELPGLSFISVQSECPSHFRAFSSGKMLQCKAQLSFQCTPELFGPALRVAVNKHPNPLNPLADMGTALDFAPAYGKLIPNAFIQDDVGRFSNQWPAGTRHIGIHIRRGDAMARDLKHATQHGARMNHKAVSDAYEKADEKIEAPRRS